MLKNKVILKTIDGNDVEISINDEDDIFFFLTDISKKDELKYFMEELIDNADLLRLFSSHKSSFYIEGFDNRPVIFTGTKLHENTLNLLKKYYKVKIQQLKSLLIPVSYLSEQIFITFVKTILTSLSEDTIGDISKLPVEKLMDSGYHDIILKEINNNAEIIKEWKKLDKTIKTLIHFPNLDLFTLAHILPYSSIQMIENMDEREDLNVLDELIDNLIKTGAMFSVMTIYSCDNYKHHSYKQPPFYLVLLPHSSDAGYLYDIKCPVCNSHLKRLSFYTFIPEISKRIMSQEGMFPYIIAYLLKREEISFIPHVKEKENETDFIITHGEKQTYVEVKCVKRKRDFIEIGTKIMDSLKQIEKNLKKWRENKKVKFDKVYLIINYSQNEINDAINKYDKLKRYLESNPIMVLGYDSLEYLINPSKLV